MIKVTQLSGRETVVNADLIESIEATPDTIVTLTTGKRIMVKESVEALTERVIQYRKATRGFTIWQRQRVPDPGISSVIAQMEMVRDMSEDVTIPGEEGQEPADAEVTVPSDEEETEEEEDEEGEE